MILIDPNVLISTYSRTDHTTIVYEIMRFDPPSNDTFKHVVDVLISSNKDDVIVYAGNMRFTKQDIQYQIIYL